MSGHTLDLDALALLPMKPHALHADTPMFFVNAAVGVEALCSEASYRLHVLTELADSLAGATIHNPGPNAVPALASVVALLGKDAGQLLDHLEQRSQALEQQHRRYLSPAEWRALGGAGD
jgi:hypothetical protein